MKPDRIAIAGAGIAGLTAALSLAGQGIASDIYEAADALGEVGAGLQISPNAARILGKLDVLPRLEAVWTEPQRIALVSGRSLQPIAHVPVGAYARKRWGAPYGVLHRATLQSALLDAVNSNPLCKLHLGHPLNLSRGDMLRTEDGIAYPLLIGADGVWSKTRDGVPGSHQPGFSGHVCWRFTIRGTQIPSWLIPDQVTAFLGPSTHLVAYPLKEIGGFNIVVIATGNDPGEAWSTEASQSQRSNLLSQFRLWHPHIVSLLEEVEKPTFWPLYEVPAGRWQDGKSRVLIGDAAHAMLPFAAQGAAMAIEDAYILAGCVTAAPTAAQALADFEQKRLGRIAKARARGMFNRFAYHARGPVRLGRDLVLSLRPPQSLAADFDWLYGFKAD